MSKAYMENMFYSQNSLKPDALTISKRQQKKFFCDFCQFTPNACSNYKELLDIDIVFYCF